MKVRPLAGLALVLTLAACRENLSPNAGGWVQVAAGSQFTCGLTQQGDAWCWGTGTFGQLGNNATVFQLTPAKVAGGHVFLTLAVGTSHACGLIAGGAAWCWGLNDYGELGVVTGICNGNVQFVDCSKVPIAVGGGVGFDSIAVAAYSSCALDAVGAAWCWGFNDHGQLGTGAAVGSKTATPVRVAGNRTFLSVTLDVNHACGTTAPGGLFCWGSNDFGQLAADTLLMAHCGVGQGFYCSASPIAAAAGVAATRVSAGSTHTCAIVSGGAAYCWGSNEYGVLGNAGSPGGRTPVAVTGNHAFARISAGGDHTCALDVGGQAFCWGLNTFGQLGVATSPTACPAFGTIQFCAAAPVAVEGVPLFVEVSAGNGHTCGLTTAGEIWCWGRGTEGQLGDGNGVTSTVPVRVNHS